MTESYITPPPFNFTREMRDAVGSLMPRGPAARVTDELLVEISNAMGVSSQEAEHILTERGMLSYRQSDGKLGVQPGSFYERTSRDRVRASLVDPERRIEELKRNKAKDKYPGSA